MNENLPEMSLGTHNEFHCTWYFHSQFHDNLSIRWVVTVLATDIETTCRTLVVRPGPPRFAPPVIPSELPRMILGPCWDWLPGQIGLSTELNICIRSLWLLKSVSISTETRKLDSTDLRLALFDVFKSLLQQLSTRGRSLNYAKLLHTRSSSGVKRVKSIRSIILLSVQPLLPSSCSSSPRYSGLLLPKPNLLWLDLDHYIYKCEPV